MAASCGGRDLAYLRGRRLAALRLRNATRQTMPFSAGRPQGGARDAVLDLAVAHHAFHLRAGKASADHVLLLVLRQAGGEEDAEALAHRAVAFAELAGERQRAGGEAGFLGERVARGGGGVGVRAAPHALAELPETCADRVAELVQQRDRAVVMDGDDNDEIVLLDDAADGKCSACGSAPRAQARRSAPRAQARRSAPRAQARRSAPRAGTDEKPEAAERQRAADQVADEQPLTEQRPAEDGGERWCQKLQGGGG
jgi:hypothetical protein